MVVVCGVCGRPEHRGELELSQPLASGRRSSTEDRAHLADLPPSKTSRRPLTPNAGARSLLFHRFEPGRRSSSQRLCGVLFHLIARLPAPGVLFLFPILRVCWLWCFSRLLAGDSLVGVSPWLSTGRPRWVFSGFERARDRLGALRPCCPLSSCFA